MIAVTCVSVKHNTLREKQRASRVSRVDAQPNLRDRVEDEVEDGETTERHHHEGDGRVEVAP